MGFLETLTLILIVLKLTDVIAWSWLLVFTPMMVGAAISLTVLGLYAYFNRTGL